MNNNTKSMGEIELYTGLFSKSKSSDSYRMHYKENDKLYELVKCFKNIISDKSIVIVCVGSDRSIGDCLAPMVGTILLENDFEFPVYGTLHDPVHALNVKEKISKIKKEHNDSLIIGIDACLGDKEDVGIIRIRNSHLTPGSGKGAKLPKVGDVSIIGIVHDLKDKTPLGERGIRLSFVSDIARVIARILILSQHE